MNSYIITNEAPADVWSNPICMRVRDKWNGQDANNCRVTSISAAVTAVFKITKKSGIVNFMKSLFGKNTREVDIIDVSDIDPVLGETLYVEETPEKDSEYGAASTEKFVEFIKSKGMYNTADNINYAVMTFSTLNSLQKVTYSADDIMNAFMEDYRINENGEFCLYMRTKGATYKLDLRLISAAVRNLPLEYDWTQLGNEKLLEYAGEHNLSIGDDVAVKIAYSDFAIKNNIVDLVRDVKVDGNVIVLDIQETENNQDASPEIVKPETENAASEISEEPTKAAEQASSLANAEDVKEQPKNIAKRAKIKKKYETPTVEQEAPAINDESKTGKMAGETPAKIKKVKSVKIKKVTATADPSIN